MTDWPVKTLSDLMTVQNGYAFDSQYFSPSGKIGLIRIRDLKRGVGTETHFVGSYDDEYVVTAGDYLIGMDGEFRCYEWKGDSALLNQRVCRLRDFGKSLDARFLFYGINKFLKEIEDVTGYTTVKHLSSKSILAIEMPVPPLEEQKRIVALLDAATERVTELAACYEQARTHANNLFTSALRDALESNPEWPVKTLGKVCEVVNGATPKTNVKEYWGGSHAWITPAEMGNLDSPLLSMSRRTLSDQGLAACSARLVPPKTVILSSRAPIGHLVINEVPMATNQGCKSLIPSDDLDCFFLYYYLKANVELLDSLGTGAVFKELSGTQLKTVEIPVPPLEEQKQIVVYLDSLRLKTSEMVAAYDAKLTAAKNLRQSILEAAFAGDL